MCNARSSIRVFYHTAKASSINDMGYAENRISVKMLETAFILLIKIYEMSEIPIKGDLCTFMFLCY